MGSPTPKSSTSGRRSGDTSAKRYNMLADRGTNTWLTRYHSTSHPSYTNSWRRSFCSGWRCSASWVRREKRLTHWSQLRGVNGRMCVTLHNFFSLKDSLELNLGVSNRRSCQRLFSLRNLILRDYYHIGATYISLGAPAVSPNVDRSRVVQAVCSSICEDCAGVAGLVGPGSCDREPWSQP